MGYYEVDIRTDISNNHHTMVDTMKAVGIFFIVLLLLIFIAVAWEWILMAVVMAPAVIN